MAASPTVRRRRLARELARFREAAGMTIEQAAESAGISMSHLSRVERAQVGVRLPVVKVLLAAYGADADTVTYLSGLAKDASLRGWWHPFTGSISSGYATYIGFETEASQIWSFDASAITGLLQTEAYARAIFHGGAARPTDEVITTRVEVRRHRQEILHGENPPRFWAILDEAVIRRQIGGAAVLRDQLEHVIKTATLPNVDVQVLPFAVGAHPGLPGSFIVLHFPEPTDPPVVYVETMVGDLNPENPDDVNGTMLAFDRLRAMALSPGDSLAALRHAASEVR